MRVRAFPLVAGLLFTVTPVAHAADPTILTLRERNEVTRALRRFYETPASDPSPLGEPTNKYDPRTGQKVSLDTSLAPPKASDDYRRARCQAFRKSLFGNGPCDTIHGLDASIEKHDRVEQLIESWVRPEGLAREMSALPVHGKTRLTLWSSDYWRARFGGISHRYAEKRKFATYKEAIAHYAQPEAWTALVRGTRISELTSESSTWSPAEKYDLSVGDETFALTSSEKNRGKSFLEEGEVPAWIGACHGWAAAAIMVPPPLKAADAVGARGMEVAWSPSDVRALVSLHWSNGQKDLNFVGGRCDAKKTETFPNGRLKQPECFDSNPATFHLALANLVGRYGHSFIMDKTFDAQVWNQPIHSYRFEYFNPLEPGRKSEQWSDVAVEYDARFKARDRFQTPLTRGMLKDGRRDDSLVRKVVGVSATVVYAAAHRPQVGATAGIDRLVREVFLYDLELESENGKWIPTGGEWQKNSHPDFLWIPKRGSVASHTEDAAAATYSPTDGPTPALTASAQKASRADGYPLCSVVRELTILASGKAKATIRCDKDPDTSTWLTELPAEKPEQPRCEKPDATATVVVSSDFPTAQLWIQGRPMGDFSRSGSQRITTTVLKGCQRYTYDLQFYSPRLTSQGYFYQTQRVRVTFGASDTVKVHLDHRGEISVETGVR